MRLTSAARKKFWPANTNKNSLKGADEKSPPPRNVAKTLSLPAKPGAAALCGKKALHHTTDSKGVAF